jgi:hypothetical protein
MKKFYVKYTRYVTELETVTVAVEADNKEWALEKAKTGDGEEVNWETYDRSVEDEYWDEEVEVMTEEDMGFIKEAVA